MQGLPEKWSALLKVSGISQKEVAQNPQVAPPVAPPHVTLAGPARCAQLLHGRQRGGRLGKVHDAQEEAYALLQPRMPLTTTASVVHSPSLPAPSTPIITHPAPKLEPVRQSHPFRRCTHCTDAAGAGRARAPCTHRVGEDQGGACKHYGSQAQCLCCSRLYRRHPPLRPPRP